jgi:hypothetical protein
METLLFALARNDRMAFNHKDRPPAANIPAKSFALQK